MPSLSAEAGQAGPLPLVSVIIPTYNHGRYICRAVESVLTQTYPDIEIVVVDDGSTDNTQTVLKAYRRKIRYIKQKNRGPAVARNQGLFFSKGTYVAFLDADDIFLPENIKQKLNFIRKHPEYRWVYSNWLIVEPGSEKGRLASDYPRTLPHIDGQGYVFYLALMDYQASTNVFLFERGMLEESGGFDEKLEQREDYDLYLRLAFQHRLGYIDSALVKVFQSSDSYSRCTNEQGYRMRWAVNQKIESLYPQELKKIKVHWRNIQSDVYRNLSAEAYRKKNYRRAQILLAGSMRARPWQYGIAVDWARILSKRCYLKHKSKGPPSPSANITDPPVSQRIPENVKALLAIVGRSEPKTGGEFYNRQALCALARELGPADIIEKVSMPLWIRTLYPRLKMVYYLLGNLWITRELIRRHPRLCYLDFHMFPFCWIAKTVTRLCRTRWMVLVHEISNVDDTARFWQKLHARLQKHFLKECSVVIATSRSTSYRLVRELGLTPDRTLVIYPGLSIPDKRLLSLRKGSNKSIDVLYAGMVIKHKSLLDLVKVAGTLNREGIRIVIHVAGRTDIEPDYTDAVRKEAHSGKVNVVFHGFLTKKELEALFIRCRIFVLPSRHETFGMVIAEAMGYGLPVVATDTGGIPELVDHNQNGLLFRPGDLKTFSNHLRRLCRSADERWEMGRQARHKAENMPDWGEMQQEVRSALQLVFPQNREDRS